MRLSRRARSGRQLTAVEREADLMVEMLRVNPANEAELLPEWDGDWALHLLDRIAHATQGGGMGLPERDRLARKLYRISRRAELVRAAEGVSDPWLPEDVARELREFARPIKDLAGLARWLEPRAVGTA